MRSYRLSVLLFTISFICGLCCCQEQKPSGKGLAILDFEVRGDAPQHIGETIANAIACRIKSEKYQVIERRQIKRIVKERLINADATITQDLAKKFKDIGAAYLMLGFVERTEGLYYGGYRVVEVETARRANELRKYIKKARNYSDFVDQLCVALESGKAAEAGNGDGNGDIAVDLAKAAQRLVGQIGPSLVENRPQGRKYRVGIFAFGDSRGKATTVMGNLPVLIQGELASRLRSYLGQQAPGKFIVLDGQQLELIFSSCAVSPIGVNANTLPLALKILQKVRIDIAIVGQYGTRDPQKSFAKGSELTGTTIFTKKGDKHQYSTLVATDDLRANAGSGGQKASQRFQVEFYVKMNERAPDDDRQAWRHLPLQVLDDPDSRLNNSYFLVLKPEMEGKRYKIRLVNKGTPKIDDHPLDRDRLIAAALLIDGVNSFYQDRGDGRIGPVVRHPAHGKKWVLTAPGRRLVPCPGKIIERIAAGATTTIANAALADVDGPGHSVVEVIGFQKNRDFADAFVFATPGDSIAETVGITSNVGMIAVHFFGEQLPGATRSAGGTRAGEQVASRTLAVKFATTAKPLEVWRIFYRYADDLPCSVNKLRMVVE